MTRQERQLQTLRRSQKMRLQFERRTMDMRLRNEQTRQFEFRIT
jgi:hypothetical protein